MGDHGIEVAGPREKCQTGTAKSGKGSGVMQRGLGNNPDSKALGFQDTANHGRCERWVIYISVSGDKDEITFIPAPFFHVCPAYGQKIRQLYGFSL